MPCLMDAKIALVPKHPLKIPSTLLAPATDIRTYKVTKIHMLTPLIYELFWKNKKLSSRVGCKKKALTAVCSSSIRLSSAKPAKNKQKENKVLKRFSATLQSRYFRGWMKSAFVWHVPCFDCLSRILHFRIRLLFLSWSVGQNAALSKSELLYGCMAFDVRRYVCLHILHPHRKESTSRSCPLFSLMTLLTVNFISTFCTQFQLLCTQFQLSVLF